jgi:hypothetical protein
MNYPFLNTPPTIQAFPRVKKTLKNPKNQKNLDKFSRIKKFRHPFYFTGNFDLQSILMSCLFKNKTIKF